MSRFILKRLAQLLVLSAGLLSTGTYVSAQGCGPDETFCNTSGGPVCCSAGYSCCPGGGGYCSLDCGPSNCPPDETECNSAVGTICCAAGYQCCTSGGGYCGYTCD